MFDGAKILLSPCNYFTDIGNHATAVSAVCAMKFLNKIKIIELLSIKYDVVGTPYFLDAVNWEAGELVEANKKVSNK